MQSGWTSGSVGCPELDSEEEVPVAQPLQRPQPAQVLRVYRGHSIPVLRQSDRDPWDIRYYGNTLI